MNYARIAISGVKSIRNSLLMMIALGIFLLPDPTFASSINTDNILRLTNIERTDNSADILTINSRLVSAAENKAADIFKSQSFSHNISERKFSAWIKDAGYAYGYVGENLAMDFVTSEGMIKAWLDSPTHRKNLLNPEFKEIGIAVASGQLEGKETTIVVQIFGSPLNNGSKAVTLTAETEMPASKNMPDDLRGNVLTSVKIKNPELNIPGSDIYDTDFAFSNRAEQYYMNSGLVTGDYQNISSSPASDASNRIAMGLLSPAYAGTLDNTTISEQPSGHFAFIVLAYTSILLLLAGITISFHCFFTVITIIVKNKSLQAVR